MKKMKKQINEKIRELDYLLDLYVELVDDVYDYHYLSDIHDCLHRYFGYLDAVEAIAQSNRERFKII